MEQTNIESGKQNVEIYQALKSDHDEIKQLLDQLLGLSEDDEYRYTLIEQIRDALIPHARAEESVFYNTLRAVDDEKKLVFHAYKEHLEAESLLRTLQVMDRFDSSWKNLAVKLRDALTHHIQEEETEMFEEAKNVFTREEAVAMADAFEKLKPEFRQEGLMKNTFNMMINMLPPRIADKLKNFGSGDQARQ